MLNLEKLAELVKDEFGFDWLHNKDMIYTDEQGVKYCIECTCPRNLKKCENCELTWFWMEKYKNDIK